MPANAVVSFIAAAICAAVALAFFVGPAPIHRAVAAAEEAVAAAIGRLDRLLAFAGRPAGSQRTVSFKLDQELSRTRSQIKALEQDRARLEKRVAQLEKAKAKEDWGSFLVTNSSNIVSVISSILCAFFAWLGLRYQRKATP